MRKVKNGVNLNMSGFNWVHPLPVGVTIFTPKIDLSLSVYTEYYARCCEYRH